MNEILLATEAIESLKSCAADSNVEASASFGYDEPYLDVLFQGGEPELPESLKRMVAGRLAPLFKNSSDIGQLVDFVAYQVMLEPCRRAFAAKFEQDQWLQSRCPFCGSSAGLAYLEEEGARKLVCHFCWTEWQYPRGTCSFCERESDQYALFEVDDQDVRLDQCNNCNYYLKTSISGRPESLARFDIKTFFLDEWAHEKGLTKPGPSLIGIHFFN